MGQEHLKMCDIRTFASKVLISHFCCLGQKFLYHPWPNPGFQGGSGMGGKLEKFSEKKILRAEAPQDFLVRRGRTGAAVEQDFMVEQGFSLTYEKY